MTDGEHVHQAAVAAWFERVALDSSADVVRAFEATFAALWQRSQLTLGEVTLSAIVERVLHTAKEHYPSIASIEVSPAGLRCESLLAQTGARLDQLAGAFRFVLLEFLTVLGNLTAQILTPALHAALAASAPGAKASGHIQDEAS